MSSGHDTSKKQPAKPVSPGLPKDRDAGAVLRTVYQATVEEAVPDDLLDLLGKLS